MKSLNVKEIMEVSGGIVDDVIGGHGYAGGPSGGSTPAPSGSWLDRWLDLFGTPFRDM